MDIQKYNKLIVAIVGLLVIILNNEGVPVAEELSDNLVGVLTAVGVWFFPNH